MQRLAAEAVLRMLLNSLTPKSSRQLGHQRHIGTAAPLASSIAAALRQPGNDELTSHGQSRRWSARTHAAWFAQQRRRDDRW
jgi:hypothetical protein